VKRKSCQGKKSIKGDMKVLSDTSWLLCMKISQTFHLTVSTCSVDLFRHLLATREEFGS